MTVPAQHPDDTVAFIDGNLIGKVHNPDPRPLAHGHEAVLVGYDRSKGVAVVSAEFGDHRATAEVPWAAFAQLVDSVREEG